MGKTRLKPQKTLAKRAFPVIFSFIIVSNFFAPAFAYAGGNSNLIVSNTITFNAPGNSSWTVPAGVSAITVEVWGAGGAGGSGQKTNNSNLSGIGGGGGGYTQETINVNQGDIYSVTVGAGGAGDGQNGGASSLVGSNANLLTTGGFAGASNTGTGPGYPTSGGAGGIGNGGNNATNLGGGNGGVEGCDPSNCGGNARATGGGGAAAGGAGGLGLTPGDTNGTAGSSGVSNISGGGAGGSAGWCGRGVNGSCNGGDPSSAHAGDGVFPGGGGGGSDVGQGGFGADGEVIIETLVPAALASQAAVSSSDATIQLGQSFVPAEVGGSGTGTWQFVIANYTNWNPGNGYSGTDTGTNPASDTPADYISSWTPVATGTYQFYVAKNGDGNYAVSNFAGPYALIVTSSGGGNPPTSSTSPSVDISVASPNITVGSDATITSVALGSGLTHHGIELSSDNVTWQNVGANNPPTNGTDNLSITLPLGTVGTFYVRAYASNDGGQTYVYTNPKTITVSAASGGGNPPGNPPSNPPASTTPPTVSISVAATSTTIGGAVGVSTTATGGTLTQHGVEICLSGGNCPANVSSGNWINVGASNPPTNPSDTLSINPALNSVGTYDIRAYASNDGGATYAYSNVDTVTVASSGGGGNPPNPTYVLEALPQGGGTVTSVPSGLSCSSASGCSATFNAGTSVTLTETPNVGNVFSAWGNDCAFAGSASTCVVTMNSDLIARATFVAASSNPPIGNPPGAPVINGPTTGTTNATYTFSASSTDPDGDQVQFTFDMNNTGVFGGTTTPVASGVSVPFSDTWTTAGTYTFAVAAVDSSGETATSTYSIDISAPSNGGGGSGGGGGSSGGGPLNSINGGVGSLSGGSHIYSNTMPLTTTTVTTVANASVNAPVTPVVGPSVCKAGDYITAYMKQGINNDPAEVTKLQNFLNQYEGANLDVNGTFDASTTAAVEAFQLKYAKDVLSPWGISAPTGVVYITTTHEINNIFCSLNPNYIGGPSATTTPQFNGAVGFNSANSSSTTNLGGNIAGVIGAVNQNVKDFLKDILWYPLLILLLIGTGIWVILRYIFLKDKKNINKQKIFLYSIGLFSAGSVLNMANTLFYILAPAAFMNMTNMTAGTVLGLDLVNIVSMLAATLSSLYVFQSQITKGVFSLA